MKIFTMLSIGLLTTALGCQSAEPPAVRASDTDSATQKVTQQKSIAKDDDHSHEEPGEKKAPRIALDDAKKAFDSGEAVFVDTRGSAFYSNEHVKGAINVPSSDFDNTYKSIPKNRKIIAYCS